MLRFLSRKRQTFIPQMYDSRRYDGVDTMWGTDLTTTVTGEGRVQPFIAVDHCTVDRVGGP